MVLLQALKVRFFPKNSFKNAVNYCLFRFGVYVPAGIAAFPEEITHVPCCWAKMIFKNIVSYSYMPRGGHFAAFEEPKLLAQDIIHFVRRVEQL